MYDYRTSAVVNARKEAAMASGTADHSFVCTGSWYADQRARRAGRNFVFRRVPKAGATSVGHVMDGVQRHLPRDYDAYLFEVVDGQDVEVCRVRSEADAMARIRRMVPL
jgi:hypothetical protein